MIIKTRYNRKSFVYTIHNDRIVKLMIERVKVINSVIYYELLVSKSQSLMDKDVFIEKEEIDCFRSVNSLAIFYKNKLDK